MPFENFYKESDKAARRWWKIAGLALLLLIGLWAFRIFILPESIHVPMLVETPAVDGFSMVDAEAVRRVDGLCASLPNPEKFFFIEKDEPKSFIDSTSIVYRYRSNRLPEEIMPSFLIWFNDNGWRSIADNATIFRKGRQTVSVRVLKPFDIVTGYEIECYESDY